MIVHKFKNDTMPKINFFTEDISYVIKGKTALKKWVAHTIAAENYALEELNFILCSDNYLLEINKEYLQHDYFTDVITFDNADKPKTILGDIFISLDRVKENAKLNNVKIIDELCRVMIHGTLHLLGYVDKTKKDKLEMTARENHYLELR